MKSLIREKKIYMIAMLLVILGSINWGVKGLFKKDIVEEIGERTNKIVSKIIYVIIGLSGLFLISKRDVYLPFLGQSVIPCSSMIERIPNNHTEEVIVNVSPNSNVVYWAAEPENEKLKKMANPWDAYQNFSNSGVVKSNSIGQATLKFRTPQTYAVKGGRKILQPHVHYRYCEHPGMMSRIETVKL